MRKKLSVRTATSIYALGGAAFGFIALTAYYGGAETTALILSSLALLTVIGGSLTDRIEFDGQTLRRRGFIAGLQTALSATPSRLALSDVQWVEMTATRRLRRGNRLFYQYDCRIFGEKISFAFNSNNRRFIALTRGFLRRLPDYKLDARSCEVRDYLDDKPAVAALLDELRRRYARFAATEAWADFITARTGILRASQRTVEASPAIAGNSEDAARWRAAANRLRLAGYMAEAAEAFWRAFQVDKNDARLLFDYARFLNSVAGVMRDSSAVRHAQAALRLARRRAAESPGLLARIGETYLEHDAPETANRILRRVLNLDQSAFRAAVGLAEISFREGKLAYLVTHYNRAVEIAPDAATRKLAAAELRYFTCLHDDENYLEAEVKRMNRLETAYFWRRSAARVTLIGILIAISGHLIDAEIPAIALAVSGASFTVWLLAVIFQQINLSRKAVPQI